MKNFFVAMILVLASLTQSCMPANVPPGHAGIMVNLLGDDKGVQRQVLEVGRYWLTMNEELYVFPLYNRDVKYGSTDKENESGAEPISFQTNNGLTIKAPLSVEFSIEKTKIPILFETYRKGVEELEQTILLNAIRDSMSKAASSYDAAEISTSKKAEFLDKVQVMVSEALAPSGVIVKRINILGGFVLPESVQKALEAKVRAVEESKQKEEELRKAEAEARITVATAEGEAQSIKVRAEAQAAANEKLAQSLTAPLVEYEKIKKWNGVLPTVSAGSGGLILDVGNR